MSLNASKSRLDSISKELSIQWEQTKNYWRDQKALDFEQKYLDELFRYAGKTILVIEKLDEILKKVRSDCE
ncbi:MAG TPA: hypothetical protein VMO20_06605 [Candidatus Acidoferrum sp.]|jgi:hypothetical protein|nr:hypothetical protein [Candidatus Acidoferrum sp.]